MFDSGMGTASVGVPTDLVITPKRLEDCVTWEELFLGMVAAGVGVPADLVGTPQRLVDCVAWEELFLGMDTDATCAVVVVVAVKNEDVPEEAGTGALEDCATGPT
jgi:hypothetical protein